MNVLKEENNDHVTDVVDEFDYSTQSESYNRRFSEWRKDKNNPYVFFYSINRKESVFIEGKGFVNTTPSEVESRILGRLLSLIGAALLAMIFISKVLGKLFIYLLDISGVNIHEVFYSSVIYGGRKEVTAVMIITTTLKLMIPMLIINSQLKMPRRLARPLELRDPKELIIAIALALIASIVVSIPNAYSPDPRNLFEFFRAYNADFSVWEQNEFIIYTFFDVIVVSILFEILFRGSMFTALRQYGDVYAVIISSLAACLAANDIQSMIATLIFSVVSSIGLLRTGTIYTAIVVHIIYKLYALALNLIETSTSPKMYLYRNISMVTLFVLCIFALWILLRFDDVKSKRTFARYTSSIRLKVKLAESFRTIIFSAAVLICLLAVIV